MSRDNRLRSEKRASKGRSPSPSSARFFPCSITIFESDVEKNLIKKNASSKATSFNRLGWRVYRFSKALEVRVFVTVSTSVGLSFKKEMKKISLLLSSKFRKFRLFSHWVFKIFRKLFFKIIPLFALEIHVSSPISATSTFISL